MFPSNIQRRLFPASLRRRGLETSSEHLTSLRGKQSKTDLYRCTGACMAKEQGRERAPSTLADIETPGAWAVDQKACVWIPFSH
jgi:hypothetical protein